MPLNHTSTYAELTEAHFSAIGRIGIEWSNLEFQLRVVLARLLLTPDFLARTYANRLIAAKIQESIDEAIEIHQERYDCKIISSSMLSEISEINKKIRSIRSTRNKFAHFCWSRVSDDEIFGTSFSGGVPSSLKDKRDCVVLSVAELISLHNEAYSAVESLEKVLKSLPEVKEPL